MPHLRDVQLAVCKAVLVDRADALSALLLPGAASAQAAISIHHQTCIGGASNALAIGFPALRALLGEVEFRSLARRVVRESPPASPWLETYGSRLEDYLRQPDTPPGPRWLADVARIEVCVNQALHADDEMPLETQAHPLATLQKLDESRLGAIRLVSKPSLSVPRVSVQAATLWRHTVLGTPATPVVQENAERPASLLVHKGPAGVAVRDVDALRWRSARLLHQGASLAAAHAAIGSGFPAALAELMADGVFAGWRTSPPITRSPQTPAHRANP